MKKIALVSVVLVLAGVAGAANVPYGVTGLWRFQDEVNKLSATAGTALTTSSTANSAFMTGSFIHIGTDAYPDALTDNGLVQEVQYQYLTATHGIAPNGGGSYVNEYTVAIDYIQTSEVGLWEGNYYNSLFNTNPGNSNDGDLFIKGPTRATSVIGTGDTGYSTLTFDSSAWHRIVWSVDNGNFFRVYVDGAMLLDGTPQAVDGRFSLDPTFLLFADNDGEDAWGLVATAAIWDHALTSSEVLAMGSTTTPLIIPEPATMSLLAIGGLIGLIRRIRK